MFHGHAASKSDSDTAIIKSLWNLPILHIAERLPVATGRTASLTLHTEMKYLFTTFKGQWKHAVPVSNNLCDDSIYAPGCGPQSYIRTSPLAYVYCSKNCILSRDRPLSSLFSMTPLTAEIERNTGQTTIEFDSPILLFTDYLLYNPTR